MHVVSSDSHSFLAGLLDQRWYSFSVHCRVMIVRHVLIQTDRSALFQCQRH